MHSIIVHGGAWAIPDDLAPGHLAGTRAAADAALDLLASGGTAEEAVICAVAIMEEDPVFDAGVGSFLNRDGDVELDAILYSGRRRRFGSIMGARRVKSPIALARRLMDEDEMSMLCGPGCETYAAASGLELVDNSHFVVDRERERWEGWRQAGGRAVEAFKGGTVGAVALDGDGWLAAGNSTGGTPFKHPGRVGDTPVPGAGAYADHLSAASATGMGEAILRVGLSRRCCEMQASAGGPRNACQAALEEMEELTGLYGGIIMMSAAGEHGFAHNTPRMARAYIRDGRIVSEL